VARLPHRSRRAAPLPRDPQRALVGEQTMRKFGWKVGQNVTLKGSAFPVDLTFQIVGEIPARAAIRWCCGSTTSTSEESLQPRPGWPFSGFPFVGMVWVAGRPPENVERIMRDIDALFHNSEAETAAETERSFFQNFMSSFQGFIRVILGVGFLVVAAVVLIAANTSAMGVRERIPEIAVLKSLGFRRRPILAVLLSESMLQGLVGGIIGAGGAYGLFRALPRPEDRRARAAPRPARQLLHVGPRPRCKGVAIALAVGAIAGIVPAWNGARLNVIEALRKLF
jgi:putative ABC transport system permease protein